MLDIDSGPVARFAADLRELRRGAGGLPYRSMATSANFAASVLSEAAAGRKLPSLAITLAYVRACGGDEDEWRGRWQKVAAERDADRSTADVGDGVQAAVGEPQGDNAPDAVDEQPESGAHPPRWSVPPRWTVWLAGTVAALLGIVGTLVVTTVLQQRDALAQPTGIVMPEHRTTGDSTVAEATPVTGEPPVGAPCSRHVRALACLDTGRQVFWLKDLPPSDGHHIAVYWTTTDGAVHGECHNFLSSDSPWVTCPYPNVLRERVTVGYRVAIVEKETVLEWGGYVSLPVDPL
jgi:hypothetical protein